MIMHITTRQEWEKAQTEGEYAAPSLSSEGFIHCSKPDQTADTANNFFRGQKGLALLCIDEKKLRSECRYEPPSYSQLDPEAGELFPHIYGPIDIAAVVKVVDFPAEENGTFALPKGLFYD